mmetsp:Transcript_1640/g.4897  ORF Transcript_1640/g.4897 Transcript_1640/m.4897 type:complete len:273 (+) Transcript_1640:1473-2291(+)
MPPRERVRRRGWSRSGSGCTGGSSGCQRGRRCLRQLVNQRTLPEVVLLAVLACKVDEMPQLAEVDCGSRALQGTCEMAVDHLGTEQRIPLQLRHRALHCAGCVWRARHVLGASIGHGTREEVRGPDALAHWLHKRVLCHAGDVCTRKPTGASCHGANHGRRHTGRSVQRKLLEDPSTSSFSREGHVDAPLEATPKGGVQLPRRVRGRNDDDLRVRVAGAHALQLHEELRLEPTRRFLLIPSPRSADRIDLVNKKNAWRVASSVLEDLAKCAL